MICHVIKNHDFDFCLHPARKDFLISGQVTNLRFVDLPVCRLAVGNTNIKIIILSANYCDKMLELLTSSSFGCVTQLVNTMLKEKGRKWKGHKMNETKGRKLIFHSGWKCREKLESRVTKSRVASRVELLIKHFRRQMDFSHSLSLLSFCICPCFAL